MYGFKNGISPFCKKDGMKTDSGDQRPNILDTPEQRRFEDFLQRIEEQQEYKDMKLFYLRRADV